MQEPGSERAPSPEYEAEGGRQADGCCLGCFLSALVWTALALIALWQTAR